MSSRMSTQDAGIELIQPIQLQSWQSFGIRALFALAVVVPLWIIAWGQFKRNGVTVDSDDALKMYVKHEHLKQRYKSNSNNAYSCLRGIPREQAGDAISKSYKKLKNDCLELQSMEAKYAITWGAMGLSFHPTVDFGEPPSEEDLSVHWESENQNR